MQISKSNEQEQVVNNRQKYDICIEMKREAIGWLAAVICNRIIKRVINTRSFAELVSIEVEP